MGSGSDVPRVRGCGACHAESAAFTLRTIKWDGSLILRCHTWDWRSMRISMREPWPYVVKGGRRMLDMSGLLPQAERTYYCIADDRCDYGTAKLETDGGTLLALLEF